MNIFYNPNLHWDKTIVRPHDNKFKGYHISVNELQLLNGTFIVFVAH